jgi:hypothetical protein
MPEDLSYKKAMEQNLLSENEVRRLACMCLSIIEKPEVKSHVRITAASPRFLLILCQLDWEVLGAEFGAAPGGFRVMFYILMRKLRAAGCIIGDDETPVKNLTPDNTPTSKSVSASGKKSNKRKVDEVNNGADADDETPTRKKRERKPKNLAIKKEEANTVETPLDDDKEAVVVKDECHDGSSV